MDDGEGTAAIPAVFFRYLLPFRSGALEIELSKRGAANKCLMLYDSYTCGDRYAFERGTVGESR